MAYHEYDDRDLDREADRERELYSERYYDIYAEDPYDDTAYRSTFGERVENTGPIDDDEMSEDEMMAEAQARREEGFGETVDPNRANTGDEASKDESLMDRAKDKIDEWTGGKDGGKDKDQK